MEVFITFAISLFLQVIHAQHQTAYLALKHSNNSSFPKLEIYKLNQNEFFEITLQLNSTTSMTPKLLYNCKEALPNWIHFFSSNNTLTGIFHGEEKFTICILLDDQPAKEIEFHLLAKPRTLTSEITQSEFSLIPYNEGFLTHHARYPDYFNKMKAVSLTDGDIMVAWVYDSNDKGKILLGSFVDSKVIYIKGPFEIGEIMTDYEELGPNRKEDLPQFDMVALKGNRVLIVYQEKNFNNKIVGKILGSDGLIEATYFMSENSERYNSHPRVDQFSSDSIAVSWIASNDNSKIIGGTTYIKIFDLNGQVKVNFTPAINYAYKLNTLKVLELNDTNILLLWKQKGAVYGRIVEPLALNEVKGAFKIAEESEFSEFQGLVLSNENVLLVVSQYKTGRTQGWINALFLNNLGNVLSKVEISPDSPRFKEYLKVTYLQNNRILITWMQWEYKHREQWREIYGIILAENGLIAHPQFLIGSFSGEADFHHYDSLLLADGSVLFIWRDVGTISDIIGKVIKDDGETLVNEFFINGDQPIVYYANPVLGNFSNGNIFVGWFTSEDNFYLADSIGMKVWGSQVTANSRPKVRSPIPSNDGKVNKPYAITIPDGMFEDPDGDSLKITVRLDDEYLDRKAWLQYDPDTKNLIGIPDSWSSGRHNITVIARDPKGAFAKSNFVVTIHPDSSFAAKIVVLVVAIAIVALVLPGALRWKKSVWKKEKKKKRYIVFEDQEGGHQISMKTENIPREMFCPLTDELMSDPWELICVDGSRQNYEGEALFEYLKIRNHDPITKAKKKDIRQNDDLRKRIEEFIFDLDPLVLKEDKNLLKEVQRWVEKRGEETLMESGKLRFIVTKLKEVALAASPTEEQV